MESLIRAYQAFDFAETLRLWDEFAAKHCQDLDCLVLSIGSEQSGEQSPVTRAV